MTELINVSTLELDTLNNTYIESSKESNETKKEVDTTSDVKVYTKQIKVVDLQTEEVLFEGLSALNKAALFEQYGNNIKVYYEKVFTTVSSKQTYREALEDPNENSCKAYSLQEFKDWLLKEDKMIKDAYLTYNQRDLDNQLKKSKKVKRVSTINSPTFGVYLYTKHEQLANIPINNLTKEQLDAARYSLKNEEEWLMDYAREHDLDINSKQVRDEQVESVLFITGAPIAIDTYIKSSQVRWITSRGGESVKGLIKNNTSNTGYQVYLLILNIQDSRNERLLKSLGFK